MNCRVRARNVRSEHAVSFVDHFILEWAFEPNLKKFPDGVSRDIAFTRTRWTDGRTSLKHKVSGPQLSAMA